MTGVFYSFDVFKFMTFAVDKGLSVLNFRWGSVFLSFHFSQMFVSRFLLRDICLANKSFTANYTKDSKQKTELVNFPYEID